ncbi:MAG: ATP-binding protein [Anaerolineae bacterium]|nr:ATP-binding protein [Anaerolineae bacterium]
MTDLLSLSERAHNSIQLGESHFREFKSAWEGKTGAKRPRPVAHICREIGEALVAFANADGGELLVGVEDDGEITGVPHSDAELAQMLRAHETHVHSKSQLPIVYNTKLRLADKVVLFFQVDKGSKEIYQLPDGRCVVRKERQTLPGVISDIQFERQEIRSREYDRQFVDGATTNDLDLDLLRGIADSFLSGLTPERYLQQVKLAEYGIAGLRLRTAALLLFAKDIQRWHPYCQVRILKVNGTELGSGSSYNVVSDEIVRGNIFYLLRESWEQLRPFLAQSTEFGADARFEQRYIYPELACREALVNAIAHRDYSVQSGIEIYIFNDRMEIKNPGALLSTISVDRLEGLEGVHDSRNALIAQVLRENKHMRELGEGMRRIFQLMEENELDQPQLYSNRTHFRVTLTSRSIFTAQQQNWLNLFASYNLSRLQKRIVVRGMNGVELSPDDIYRAMNTKDRNIYDKEVTGLRTMGILIEIRTNPQAGQYAKLHNVKKQRVPRFRVRMPHAAEQKSSSSSLQPIQPNTRIAVFNLPYDASPGEILTAFSGLGRVVNVKLRQDKDGYPYAYVTFSTAEEAQRAIKRRELQVRDKIVWIKPYRTPKREG